MKAIKIIQNILAMIIGAIFSLRQVVEIFKSFNTLTEATGAGEVGESCGYLVTSILIGALFSWMFWKGISFFIKMKKMTKEKIEEKINNIDK